MGEGAPNIKAGLRAASQEYQVETIMIICPTCKSEIDVEEEGLEEGELLSCLECGDDFEVVAVEPLKLAKVSDEEDEDEDDE
jgi:alpha-aminoadipate/glutamate carrier protein LysW